MIELLLPISGVGMLASIFVGMRAPKLWLAGVLVGSVGGLGASVVALVTGERLIFDQSTRKFWLDGSLQPSH